MSEKRHIITRKKKIMKNGKDEYFSFKILVSDKTFFFKVGRKNLWSTECDRITSDNQIKNKIKNYLKLELQSY